jgi:ATP-dependent helicase/nuclease subunit A
MSEKIDLTPVQRQAAVERLAENIALCSGAGCGKTFVLARRFAELLLSRPEVEDPLPNFVALTFTDKAALEMSQRVRKTLTEFAARAAEPERKALRRWLDAMPEARISTIHGFCASLLRAGAVEAGLDPAFTVCGEDDLFVSRLFGESAEQAVLDAAEAGDAATAELLERAGFARVVEQVEDLARMRTQCNLAQYIDSAATLRAWGTAVPAAQAKIWSARAGTQLAPLLEELDAIPCRDPGDRMAVAREQLVSALRPALKGNAPPGAEAFAAAAINLQGGSAKAWNGKEDLARVKALLKEAREIMKDLAVCAQSLNPSDELAAADLAVLARIARDVLGRYQGQKRARGLLDFTDLLENTGRLLADPATAAAVRSGIHQLLLDEAQDTDLFQIQMLERLLFGEAKAPLPPGRLFLVGDPKQSIYRFRGARVEVFEDLCSRLGKENQLDLDLSFRANRQTVGFVNHLFARLMGSEYARIEAHRSAVPPGPSVEVLLATGGGQRGPEETEEETTQGRGAMPLRVFAEGHVRLPSVRATEAETARGQDALATPDALATADAASRAEAAVAAQRIADMVRQGERLVWDERAKDWRPARYGDVAVLFSRMTASLQYERELAARDVPYYVVAGTGFFQQQEVLDVLNALAAIDNPFDDVALLGALRGGLFGLDDEALLHIAQACQPPYFEKLATLDLSARIGAPRQQRLSFAMRLLGELHRRKDAVAIDRILEQLLEETAYEAVLLSQPQGRRLAGNVRRLTELARPGAAGAVSLADFLRQMGEHVLDESRYEQAAVVAEAEDVVRLMTIHKAKGLEFPVVVLPDLSAGRRAFSDALFYRPDLGLTLRPAEAIAESGGEGSVAGGDEEPKPLSYLLARGLETEDLGKEDIRRLYVGATRAQDHLIFVGADWRGKDGEFKDSGSHLNVMGRHLDLAKCADGDGRLVYEDAGQTYHAVVRKVAPQPPPHAGRAQTPGQKLLSAAASAQEVADSLVARAMHGSTAPVAAIEGAVPELLGPLPASAASLDIAVTALADFAHCPMLYRWRYELRIPARAPAPRQAGGHSAGMSAIDPAELGTLLHRCMEMLAFERPQPAGDLVRASAEELQLPPEIGREAITREFGPLLDGLLRHPLSRQLAAAKGRLAELEFLLQEGPVRLSGKIDLLWQDDRGAWHILDYKSDRAEGKDLGAYSRRYELQMAAYALAASRYLAGGGSGVTPAVADATLFFLRRGEAHVMPMDPGNFQEAAGELARLASRLIAARRSGDFPRCRMPDCRHCSYGRYCEAVAGEEAHIEA